MRVWGRKITQILKISYKICNNIKILYISSYIKQQKQQPIYENNVFPQQRPNSYNVNLNNC